MTCLKQLVFALCLFLCMQAFAHAEPGEARGELLYTTHCNACHSAEIHWRDKRLTTDWSSLLIQVRRWQSNIDLHWRRDEINDVAHYLNALHYGFLEPGHQGALQREKTDHAGQ